MVRVPTSEDDLFMQIEMGMGDMLASCPSSKTPAGMLRSASLCCAWTDLDARGKFEGHLR
jgi:hypothetical protein